MASIFNKRQQARNERTLQELIRSVPGNDRCADCQARNPGWASWSLGIFLCMRCAALHRKLGTHLSKVKSLSMDSWANEQVENMKKVGNTTSNRSYNPRNIRPDLPLDPDEIDIAMEKFIRAKYQSQTLSSENSGRAASRNHTGSSASTEDRPPPVPAKNTPRFAPALRSVSSNIPSTQTNLAHERVASNTRATADMGGQTGYDDQLARLRDMGFVNEKRNLTLLKGLNGSVDKTVEALVRLGEGDDSVRIAASTKNNGPPPPRVSSGGPPSISQNPASQTSSNGTIQSSTTAATTAPVSNVVNQNPNMYTPQTSYNPFDVPTPHQTQMQPNSALDLAFQNMTVSQQPLSAHNTGAWQYPNQHNPFLKSYTPPMSPSPYQQPAPTNMYPSYPNQGPQRSFTDPMAQSNPFLRSTRSQTFEPSGLSNQVYQTQPTLAGLYGQQSSTPPLPPMPSWVQTQRSLSQPQFQANPFGPSVGQNGNGVFSAQAPPTQGQSPFSQPFPTQQPFQQQQSQQMFSTSPFQSPGVQTPVSFEGQNPTEYPFNSQPLQSSQAPAVQQQQAPQQQQMYTASAPVMIQPQIQPQQQQANPFPLAAMPTGAAAQRFDKQSILALYNQSYAALGSPQTATPQPPDAGNAAQPTQNQPQPQAANNAPPTAYKNPFANLISGHNLIGSHLREESKDFSALALNSNANGGRHSPDAFRGLSSRFR